MSRKNSANDQLLALNKLSEIVEPYYKEAHRVYHTFQHIKQLLAYWHPSALVQVRLRNLRVVRPLKSYEHLAILFHDIVYVPGSQNNESMSIQLMRTLLNRHPKLARDFSKQEIQQAESIIADTTYPHRPSKGMNAFVIDLDMLGFSFTPPEFLANDVAIEKEFAAVPNLKKGRRDFLINLYENRVPFYFSPEIQSIGIRYGRGSDMVEVSLEEKARTNIRRLLESKFNHKVAE